MNKIKLFIYNFAVYGFGGIISKAIPLVMLPVITRLLPDATYYGLNDLVNTVVQFGTAIAIMGMYDAVFRMFFEKDSEDYQKSVCSTALVFTGVMSLAISVFVAFFAEFIAAAVFGDKKYIDLVYIVSVSILVGSVNNILMIPTRTQNKSRTYIILNVFTAVISYSIAIPLLKRGYYLFALPLSAFLSLLLTSIAFWAVNRKWFGLLKFDYSLLKELLVIAVPLLPNFLIYWVFNSSDRLMIAKIIGASYTGIYAVGSKMGHISQLIYTAFAGGWQYFAFSTMKEKNQAESNSLIYEYLGVIAYAASVLVFAFSKIIFNVFFEAEYVNGYRVAPYLFLAPLLQMLFQVACNQFLIIKKTWPNAFILLIGAILNVVLNLNLIPVIGIEGAAIATLTGYAVSNIICVIVLIRMKLMMVSKRFLFISILVTLYVILWWKFFKNLSLYGMIFAGLLLFIFYMQYKKDVKKMLQQLKR